jgi:putative component of membrane protein insertase Oxa1/YidC/SpoIIIJ protein YidD
VIHPLAWLLVLSIKAYRIASRVVPRTRSCLFAVSCSRHVEQETRRRGFRAGVRAMRSRFAACRPGYTFEYDDESWWLIGVEGTAVASANLSPALVTEARACRIPVDANQQRSEDAPTT